MIEIVSATTNDLPLINTLAVKIWEVTYKNILSDEQLAYMHHKMNSVEALSKLINQDHKFIIPYENGIAKGYSCYKIYIDKTRIEKLYVLLDEHKKGIGKLMMNHIIEKAKEHVSIIELNVNRQNEAVTFYEKMGFKILKEVDIPIGEGFFMNDYIMQKTIVH